MATPVASWSSMRRCASIMRASSARMASTSVRVDADAGAAGSRSARRARRRCAACRRRSPAAGRYRACRRRAPAPRSSRAARSSSSSAARHRVGGIRGLDRARIGGVDEDQPPVGIARPDRRRQRVDQRRQRGRPRASAASWRPASSVSSLLDAADVAQPQHRAAADRAASPRPACRRCVVSVMQEAAAFAAQRVRPLAPCAAPCRREPAAEGEHAFGDRAGHEQRGVAENFRLGRSRRPMPPGPAAPTAAAP